MTGCSGSEPDDLRTRSHPAGLGSHCCQIGSHLRCRTASIPSHVSRWSRHFAGTERIALLRQGIENWSKQGTGQACPSLVGSASTVPRSSALRGRPSCCLSDSPLTWTYTLRIGWKGGRFRTADAIWPDRWESLDKAGLPRATFASSSQGYKAPLEQTASLPSDRSSVVMSKGVAVLMRSRGLARDEGRVW